MNEERRERMETIITEFAKNNPYYFCNSIDVKCIPDESMLILETVHDVASGTFSDKYENFGTMFRQILDGISIRQKE